MYPKRILAVLTLIMCWIVGMAQDVIVQKDGSSMLGKVVEITDSEVKYRKADNPGGPVYSMKIADIMRINYENGTTDSFVNGMPSTGNLTLSDSKGDIKDTELLGLYNRDKSDYSLPKKLKLTAFIGGGVMIAAGTIMAIIGGRQVDWGGYSDYDDSALLYAGIGVVGAGVVWGTTFYLVARHKQKQLDEMAFAPLFRQEIFEKDGKTLSMGVDYMANRINTRTLGLGMTFNF